MTTMLVVGDAVLDRDLSGRAERLAPDAPVPVVESAATAVRPGAAGLAARIASEHCDVLLITALARDAAGDELRGALTDGGVRIIDLGCEGETAQKIRVQAEGRSLLRIDHGGATTQGIGSLSGEAREALRDADAVLVSDYGRGLTSESSLRRELEKVAARAPLVWDPHPRGASPVPGVRLATPNRTEARLLAGDDDDSDELRSVARRAITLAARWRAAAVVVTLGPHGALLVDGSGSPLVTPARAVSERDACGAGDCFAVHTALALSEGALPSEAVQRAVDAASVFVARGGVASLMSGAGAATSSTSQGVVDRVRSASGTVVATGGCFDLLHAGHVSMLRAARSLGDCLVVLLNSDASVRRIKGPGRPLVPQADRAQVLASLQDVDEVRIFDEDTPERALEQLRPDIWAKGADYAWRDLPERAVVERWGGQAVVLPYLDGRSTSALVKEVARHAT